MSLRCFYLIAFWNIETILLAFVGDAALGRGFGKTAIGVYKVVLGLVSTYLGDLGLCNVFFWVGVLLSMDDLISVCFFKS